MKYSKDAYEGWVPPRDEHERIAAETTAHLAALHAAERKVLEAWERVVQYDETKDYDAGLYIELRGVAYRLTRAWLALRDGGTR